jgi:hypothetical protein
MNIGEERRTIYIEPIEEPLPAPMPSVEPQLEPLPEPVGPAPSK